MRFFLSTAATCLLAASGLAVDPPKPPPAKTADVQDLVFRTSDGLLRFRLNIQVDGKPATVAWSAFLDKVFAFYDRDSDKFLSPAEVARMPHPGVYSQGFNLIFNGRGGRPAMKFAELDANKDGKVSLDEFKAFALKAFGPVQVTVLPPQKVAEQLTDAFFKNVNKKGDGKLTAEDLRAAWASLAKLDTDEDEIISSQELLAQPINPYGDFEAVQAMQYPGQPQPQPPSPFIGLPRDATPALQAAAILDQFDREKSSPLPLSALRAGESLPKFMRTAIRQAELDSYAKWLAQPVDLELTVSLGNLAEGVGRLLSLGAEPAGVRVVKSTAKPFPLDKAAKAGADGILRVTLADALLEYGRGANVDRFDGTAQYYLQQFRMLAGDKKYVEKKDLADNPQLQFFANVFDDLDRNGDGKLTIAELQQAFDLMSAGAKAQAHISIVDQGRGLFSLIDVNHDNRLSRRELIDAWKNFAKLDKNGDGFIERSELPSQFRVTASQGQSVNNQRFVVFGMVQGNTNTGPQKGPAWFRKMDRNRDGDVSEREFLGAPAEFKEIDTDGDGLISPQEAERYDALRKQRASK